MNSKVGIFWFAENLLDGVRIESDIWASAQELASKQDTYDNLTNIDKFQMTLEIYLAILSMEGKKSDSFYSEAILCSALINKT